jgi:RNA polymerase sigma-70 factor (ECF subfamily)
MALLAPDVERRLVDLARQGDRAAFERLCRAAVSGAYDVAYRLVGSHAGAEDLLQEARLRAYQAISAFDGRARFETWFFRILVNAVSSRSQEEGEEVPTCGLDEVPEPFEVAAGGDPAHAAEHNELDGALQRALAGLPMDQRSALILVAFQGFTYADAAAVQGCPEGTLAWRVAEARRKLTVKLAAFLQ